MSIELVERYKVNDGTLFESEEQAKAYIVNIACEELNEIFKTMKLYDLKHRDLTTIISTLTGNYNSIVKHRDFLNKLLG